MSPNILINTIDRVVIWTVKYSWKYDQKQQQKSCYIRRDHALVVLHLYQSEIVERITIIPHSDTANFTWILSQNCDTKISSKKSLLDEITYVLTDRAAEFIKYW